MLTELTCEDLPPMGRTLLIDIDDNNKKENIRTF